MYSLICYLTPESPIGYRSLKKGGLGRPKEKGGVNTAPNGS